MRARLAVGVLAVVALSTPTASAAPAPWSPSGAISGGEVERIVVDPANASRAVAIVSTVDADDVDSQLFETLDAGRTWTPGATALPNQRPVSETTPLALVAGTVWIADGSGVCGGATAAGPFTCGAGATSFTSLAGGGQPGVLLLTDGSQLRRSTDGGATWTQPAGLVPHGLLTSDPTNPARVYAAGSGSRLLQSVDGGVVWTTAGQEPSCAPSTMATHAPGLLADPTVAGRLYSRGTGTALCRSDDGGATWVPVTWPQAALGEVPSGNPPPGLAVAAGGVLVAGSTAGVQRSTDGGATWTAITGLGQRAVGPVAAAGSTVYAGTARRGIFVSEDSGLTWRHASAGLPSVPLGGTGMLFTPGSDVVYAYSSTELLRSNDGGATWTAGFASASGSVEPLAVDPVDGTLYAYDAGLVASTDGGLTFTRLAQGAPFARPPLVFHVSRSRPRVLTLRADVGGRLWRSTDDGRTWAQAGRLRGFTDIAFDAVDPLRIAALVRVPGGNVLYTTSNGGTSWRRALPELVHDEIEADAVTGGVLLLGGDRPRRSTNHGRTWAPRSTAFALERVQSVGKVLVGRLLLSPGSARPGLFRSVPNRAPVSSPDGARSWTVLDVPAKVRERGVDVGATVLLSGGHDTDLLRSPLPTAHARLLSPPRLVGSARIGTKVRCIGARFAGTTASTTALGHPGGVVVALTGARGYTVPRLAPAHYACHTVARTPAGLAFASSAPVRTNRAFPGGGGEDEGG